MSFKIKNIIDLTSLLTEHKVFKETWNTANGKNTEHLTENTLEKILMEILSTGPM